MSQNINHKHTIKKVHQHYRHNLKMRTGLGPARKSFLITEDQSWLATVCHTLLHSTPIISNHHQYVCARLLCADLALLICIMMASHLPLIWYVFVCPSLSPTVCCVSHIHNILTSLKVKVPHRVLYLSITSSSSFVTLDHPARVLSKVWGKKNRTLPINDHR